MESRKEHSGESGRNVTQFLLMSPYDTWVPRKWEPRRCRSGGCSSRSGGCRSWSRLQRYLYSLSPVVVRLLLRHLVLCLGNQSPHKISCHIAIPCLLPPPTLGQQGGHQHVGHGHGPSSCPRRSPRRPGHGTSWTRWLAWWWGGAHLQPLLWPPLLHRAVEGRPPAPGRPGTRGGPGWRPAGGEGRSGGATVSECGDCRAWLVRDLVCIIPTVFLRSHVMCILLLKA